MKKEEFERLLELYDKGRLSPSQKAEMDRWMDEFSTHQDSELTAEGQDKIWANIDRVTQPRQKNWRKWLWLGAAAIVLAASATTLWFVSASNQDDKLILPDGTLVWLKSGAELLHPKQFAIAERQVELVGEALFEVARDPVRPFIIHCGDFTARVLGTSFSLKTSTTGVELIVLTGTVELSGGSMKEVLRVSSNEHVVINSSGDLDTQEPVKVEQVRAAVANTQYDMNFSDTSMKEIVRRVEGKFNVKVEVSNSDILNCMVSANFTDQSLVVTMSMISEALGVTHHIQDRTVTLTGRGCPR